jgi:hypothetical protein
LLAAWFAQIDVPSLDPQAPEGLRVLVESSLVLMPIGLIVGVLGHIIKSPVVVGIGIALVMAGTAIFFVAIAGYG